MKYLILTTSMGHESIAKAIEQALSKDQNEVMLVKETFSEVTFQYQPIYQFFPRLNGKYYKIAKNELVIKLMENIYTKKKRAKITKIINDYKPDIVISTYFLYNFALSDIKNELKFKFINIVANPKTVHPLEFSPEADYNLVYDEETLKQAEGFEIPKEKLKEIGWFTQRQFFKIPNPKPSKNDKLTILISAGSLGTNNILKFLPTFFHYQKDFKYIFVAGKNRVLHNIFKNYKKLCSMTKRDEKDIIIIGYTEKMSELMHEADIVAGKAGPNLLFEAVASGKPFLALTYIPGQEDGNLDIIETKNLGWNALTPKKAQEILSKIAKNGELLGAKNESISKERDFLEKTGERLIALLEN